MRPTYLLSFVFLCLISTSCVNMEINFVLVRLQNKLSRCGFLLALLKVLPTFLSGSWILNSIQTGKILLAANTQELIWSWRDSCVFQAWIGPSPTCSISSHSSACVLADLQKVPKCAPLSQVSALFYTQVSLLGPLCLAFLLWEESTITFEGSYNVISSGGFEEKTPFECYLPSI
jgi:hypothetical protein